MTQDVTVEATAGDAETDVKVETVQAETPEVKDEVEIEEVETESHEDGVEEVEQKPKTVEERLADMETKLDEKAREVEAKQKKIDRQTAAYNDMQRALEKERQERQEALTTTAETTEPSIDDFNTHQEYVEAVSNWKAEKIVQEKQDEFSKQQEQQKMQALSMERAKIANEQETEYLKVNPRYKASKSEFEGFISTAKVDPQVESAIVQMAYKGDVPSLIDYFGSNNGERIDELESIIKLSSAEAAVEIYKIQQKLVTPKKEDKKPLPKPVKAAPASKSSKSIDKMSGDEFMKRMGLK